MKQVTIADRRFNLTSIERAGQWIAHAIREDNGERFLFFCKAVLAALPKLPHWPDMLHTNDWQTGLLPVLLRETTPRAERDYHRAIAGSAFANPTESPGPFELQKESLEAVEAARVRLDEIRARKPQ